MLTWTISSSPLSGREINRDGSFSLELRKRLFKWKGEHKLVFSTREDKKLGRRNMLRDCKRSIQETRYSAAGSNLTRIQAHILSQLPETWRVCVPPAMELAHERHFRNDERNSQIFRCQPCLTAVRRSQGYVPGRVFPLLSAPLYLRSADAAIKAALCRFGFRLRPSRHRQRVRAIVREVFLIVVS